MRTIRDSVRVERPVIHRSKAEDEARSAVTKTAMVQVAAAVEIGRHSAANSALRKGLLRRNDEQARVAEQSCALLQPVVYTTSYN